MKNSITFFLLIYFNLTVSLFSNEIKILYKVNDGVITNQDVIEEMNYLVSFNPNLLLENMFVIFIFLSKSDKFSDLVGLYLAFNFGIKFPVKFS